MALVAILMLLSRYGWKKPVGSIVPGWRIRFTILTANLLTTNATRIKHIPLWRTVQEGRILAVHRPGGLTLSERQVCLQELQELRLIHYHN